MAADNELLANFRIANSSFAWADKVAASIAYTMVELRHAASTERPCSDESRRRELELTLAAGASSCTLHPAGRRPTASWYGCLKKVSACAAMSSGRCSVTYSTWSRCGDRYRDALTVIESIEVVRELGAEVLLTGHFGPITGRDRIRAELTRLRDAVAYIHDQIVAGMNAGKDVLTLMREVALPPELEVGEGYGWSAGMSAPSGENYAGWFHHRSTTSRTR